MMPDTPTIPVPVPAPVRSLSIAVEIWNLRALCISLSNPSCYRLVFHTQLHSQHRPKYSTSLSSHLPVAAIFRISLCPVHDSITTRHDVHAPMAMSIFLPLFRAFSFALARTSSQVGARVVVFLRTIPAFSPFLPTRIVDPCASHCPPCCSAFL